MYRLLLVTDKEEIRTLYKGYPEWESQGFERPSIASNVQEGVEMLTDHRFDVVSWLLPLDEGKEFFTFLNGRQPELMGMETVRDESRLRKEIGTTRRALATRDASRSMKQVDDLTQMMQTEFFCRLLRGDEMGIEKINERFRTLKIEDVQPDRPIATASFRLPQGDFFLAEVWKYGRQRLENALKNVFESGERDMSYTLLMINPHHMRLIAMPRCDMDKDEVYARMVEHVHHCQEVLEQFFELTLTIKRIISYDNLYALGIENGTRTAQ